MPIGSADICEEGGNTGARFDYHTKSGGKIGFRKTSEFRWGFKLKYPMG